MQIGLSLNTPSHLNLPFEPTNNSSVKPLQKPSIKPLESIQIHLSNLEKWLQTQQSSNNGRRREKKNKLLDGLDLSKIFPQMKAPEEMSPRNLNRLKRLLSLSKEYSPRNSLASGWREYHGCNNWENLLDPLDENLRREVIKYGELVQAAYQTFQSNPSTTENDMQPLSPRHVALPDSSSYKVTKSLYATSSISLLNRVDDMTPDLSWLTQRSSWVGFVAVCDDQLEIARMGRRDIVISLRGTSTCLEWMENVKDLLVKIAGDVEHSDAKVRCGFLNLYKTNGSILGLSSLSDSIVAEIHRLMDRYKGETLSISITGHSLGAALSLLAADELSTSDAHMPPIAVYSFGSPRVGNRSFANRITKNGVKVLRVVNSQDMVTRVPGMFVNETLGQKLRTSKAAHLLQVLGDNVPWAYSHVGSELRVDSKMSPYLKPNADVGCCHDLEAYLHLVDGFCASGSPFRANAKRSLARLLHEQGSNVKKLYRSKAHGLN